MFKRLLALVGTAALITGVSLVAAPLAASAHTGDLFVTAACQADGNYKLTATLKIANTSEDGDTKWMVGDSNFDGTPKAVDTPFANGPIHSTGNPSTITLTTFTLPGTTTGFGPWVYAQTRFVGDNFFVGSDGQLTTKLKGDCKAPPGDVTINPVIPQFTCVSGTSYTPPAQDEKIKYSLLPDGTRPTAGVTVFVPAGVSVTIEAHLQAQYLVANGGNWNPADYKTTIVGQSTNTLDCHGPIQCVASGGWAYGNAAHTISDEGDPAPVQGQHGLDFFGPGLRDIYQRVTSGNAQGITSWTVTYAPGSTGQPAQAVIEVHSSTFVTPSNPTGFATFSTNLTAAEAVGTVNVLALPAGPTGWSTTKIASPNPGSLANPLTYSGLVALAADNTLASAPSLHLLSGATASDKSTVSAVNSSCGSFDNVPTMPEISHRTATVTTDEVCTKASEGGSIPGGGTSTTTVTKYTTTGVWNNDTHKYDLVETVDSGYPVVTTNTIATDATCPKHVTPAAPTVTTVGCGLDQSMIVPANTADISYSVLASTKSGATLEAAPTSGSVVLDVPAGWTANENGTADKSVTYNAVVNCITHVQLALTGSVPIPAAIGGALALLVGLTLVTVRWFRRRNASASAE